MEEKKLKILLNKNGNGILNPRFPIPIEWFRKMNLSEENREVTAIFDEEKEQIIITKLK